MHVKKFVASATGHIFSHCLRCEGIKFGNQNIDASKTHLNYDALPSFIRGDISPREKYDTLLTENIKLKRRDVNTLVSVVIQTPKDFDSQYNEQFFRAAADFLTQRYGADNAICAPVHMDEATPHMHFLFCPIQDGRFNAKKVVNRTDLSTLHWDMQQHLSQSLGFEVDIMRDEVMAKYMTVEELKAKTHFDQHAEELKTELIALRDERKRLEADLDVLRAEHTSLSADIKKWQLEASTAVRELNMYHKLERSHPEVRQWREELSIEQPKHHGLTIR